MAETVPRPSGKGKAVVRAYGKQSAFSELSYAYPLKLLSPRLQSTGSHPASVAYVLSYGGGLVPGDKIDLEADVGDGAALMLLTQGSTKIFRTRTEYNYRLANSGTLPQDPSPASSTIQQIDVTIRDNSILLLLVDPVTCFRDAAYTQYQAFHLAPTASLVALDWLTSGRMSRGEEWDFARYHSVNEVWRDGRRLARDAVLLEASSAPPFPLPPRTLRDTLRPYACYATVFLFGPLVKGIAAGIQKEQAAISQMQVSEPPPFIWSFSAVDGGWILRAAGTETDIVRGWLREALRDVEAVIGKELYSKAFA
ncbi:UreD-domain-containing protein [Hysterangium stoloniferum]|nr:UreD-domain-containing protein [Hysterangium stoloniferum]